MTCKRLRLERVGLALALLILLPRLAAADAVERMSLEKLRATHERIEALKKERHPVTLVSGYDDVRTLLHVHSAFSHDSRGTLDEILAAAKETGVRVIMFSEHKASHYDYINDGHKGLKDGVLLIPGAETEGFLAYPRKSIQNEKTEGPQQLSDLVRSADGLSFVSHLEERMDWDIKNVTGNEIYNTHADFKDEVRLVSALRSPLTMLGLGNVISQYPQEFFGALLDYPADYLKRWDELCQESRHTGISANDSHHNQAFRGHLTEAGKIRLEDALGKKIVELDPEKIPLLKAIIGARKPGDVVFELDLDPYARSFRHVSTHLLMKEVTEDAVREALAASRAYVAFDWIADPSGFVYQATNGDEKWPLGAEVPLSEGLTLRAESPLDGTLKLVKNGSVIAEKQGASIEHRPTEPGVYRVEVWQTLAAEPRPWILTNPIYVRPQ